MTPMMIIIAVSLSALFITLGTGANAAFKTPQKTSVIAIKFAFFMAVSYFCFFYIGAWITQYLLGMMSDSMWLITASFLFLAIAVKTIWNVFTYKPEDNVYNLSKTFIQLMLSIAGGFNALLLSIALLLSLAALAYSSPDPVSIPILEIALLTTLGAFAGAMSGAKLSVDAAKLVTKLRPALVGAAIVLVLAVYFFVVRK